MALAGHHSDLAEQVAGAAQVLAVANRGEQALFLGSARTRKTVSGRRDLRLAQVCGV